VIELDRFTGLEKLHAL